MFFVLKYAIIKMNNLYWLLQVYARW